GLGVVSRFSVIQPYDDRLTAAVEVKITDRVAQSAVHPEPAENTFKVAVAIDGHCFVRRPTESTTDKSGDRCGNTSDGSDAAGNLFNVNAWIGWCDWHDETSKVRDTIQRMD